MPVALGSARLKNALKHVNTWLFHCLLFLQVPMILILATEMSLTGGQGSKKEEFNMHKSLINVTISWQLPSTIL